MTSTTDSLPPTITPSELGMETNAALVGTIVILSVVEAVSQTKGQNRFGTLIYFPRTFLKSKAFF